MGERGSRPAAVLSVGLALGMAVAGCAGTTRPRAVTASAAPELSTSAAPVARPPARRPLVHRRHPVARVAPAHASAPTPSPLRVSPAAPPLLAPVGGLPPGRPLRGKVVGIDPGHNGMNWSDPGYIDQPIYNGRETESCDTTGTQTDSGYTEALYNWNVATYLAADLQQEGARVVLTRSSNNGVGPCVTTRAQIINQGAADVAVDIHADGGPPDGRGFTVLEPVADGPNDRVIAASDTFALDVRSAFERYTGMPVSTYDGTDGLQPRDDLAGLNLTTVPKILIETGNMRNAADAALLTSTSFQLRAARALALAVTSYLG